MDLQDKLRDFFRTGSARMQALSGRQIAAAAALAALGAAGAGTLCLAVRDATTVEQARSTLSFGQAQRGDAVQVTLLDPGLDRVCTADLSAPAFAPVRGELNCRQLSGLTEEERQTYAADTDAAALPLRRRVRHVPGRLELSVDYTVPRGGPVRAVEVTYDLKAGTACTAVAFRLHRPSAEMRGIGQSETGAITQVETSSGWLNARTSSCVALSEAPAAEKAELARLVRDADNAALSAALPRALKARPAPIPTA